MEICFVIAEAGGSPVEYMSRSIRELRKWLKARNSFVKKRNEIKEAAKEGG